VQETWEKCEVDPTCCCAEQVDRNMAIRVVLEKPEGGSLEYYFAEEELVVIKEGENVESESVAESKSVAFDGMSCMAFKVDQLGLDHHKRGIASYDPNTSQ
jgi:hypothetical protein